MSSKQIPTTPGQIEEIIIYDILKSLHGRDASLDAKIENVMATRYQGANHSISQETAAPMMLLGYPHAATGQDMLLAASEKAATLLDLNFLDNPPIEQPITKNDFVFISIDTMSEIKDYYPRILRDKGIASLVNRAAGATLLLDGLPELMTTAATLELLDEDPGPGMEIEIAAQKAVEKISNEFMGRQAPSGLYLCATNNSLVTEVKRFSNGRFKVFLVPSSKLAPSASSESSDIATADQHQSTISQTVADGLRSSSLAATLRNHSSSAPAGSHLAQSGTVTPGQGVPSDDHSAALMAAVKAGHAEIFQSLLPSASEEAKTAALKLAGRMNNEFMNSEFVINLLPVTNLLTVFEDLPYFSPLACDTVVSSLPLDIVKDFVSIHGTADLPSTRKLLESARLQEYASKRLSQDFLRNLRKADDATPPGQEPEPERGGQGWRQGAYHRSTPSL